MLSIGGAAPKFDGPETTGRGGEFAERPWENIREAGVECEWVDPSLELEEREAYDTEGKVDGGGLGDGVGSPILRMLKDLQSPKSSWIIYSLKPVRA